MGAIGKIRVKVDSLFTRKAASFDAPVVKTIHKNSEWEVFYEQNGLYCLGGKEFTTASSKFVEFTSYNNTPNPANTGTQSIHGIVKITASAVNLRTGPGLNYETKRTLPNGSEWEVFAKNGDWYNVGGEQWITANPQFVHFTPDGANVPSGGGSNTTNGSNGGYGEVPTSTQNDSNPTIIWDPGHGGVDSGAVGHGQREKDWTLKLALYQHSRCKQLGIRSAMTRTTDRTLEPSERTRIVRNSGAKYCISDHNNSGGGVGAETIKSIYSKSALAQNILDELVACGRTRRRCFTRTGNGGSDYYFMHRETGSAETVIVEYEFIDNQNAFASFMNNWQAHAEAVLKGLCKELGVTYRRP